MSRINLSTPFDFASSAFSGWKREHWEESFKHLMVPIFASASPLGSRQLIPGPRSHHGRLADELEGFTRSFIMAAPWLAASGGDSFRLDGDTYDVAAFYRRGILAGTDPASPEYWGDPVDFAQHLVECASLAWGLWLSRARIWDRFTADERGRVAAYLYACTRVKYHPNNWLLFNVVTNAVLKRFGMPYRQEQIDENLVFCDRMYLGGGWYQDGDVPRIDYYNAWAFHYYYLMWAILDGDSKPDLALAHREKARLFLRSFAYLMAADGETPCFGRSEIYRFGFVAPIALFAMLGEEDLAGELRTLADLGVKWFLTKDVLTEAGHLSLGYVGACNDMLEHYSCSGSPYWAVKAFNVLALPADHPFWTVPESPLPIHKGSFSAAIPEAGLTISGDGPSGRITLVNHKARHDKAEYNDKYTKFAYATAFTYQARRIYGNSDCDAVLQFSADGAAWHQRWTMETLACSPLGGASRYPLFEADGEGSATTTTLMRGDVLIHLHAIRATRTLSLREGGFAAGSSGAEIRGESIAAEEDRGLGPGVSASADGRISLIRSLWGWQKAAGVENFAQDRLGANVRWVRSATPRLEAIAGQPDTVSPFHLATLVVARVGPDTPRQAAGALTTAEFRNGELRVTFADGACALIRTPDAASVPASFLGRRIQAGTLAFLLETDGRESSLIESGKK